MLDVAKDNINYTYHSRPTPGLSWWTISEGDVEVAKQYMLRATGELRPICHQVDTTYSAILGTLVDHLRLATLGTRRL